MIDYLLVEYILNTKSFYSIMISRCIPTFVKLYRELPGLSPVIFIKSQLFILSLYLDLPLLGIMQFAFNLETIPWLPSHYFCFN